MTTMPFNQIPFRGRFTVAAFIFFALLAGRTKPARAEQSELPPARLFLQAGTGLVEVAHAEVGVFAGPHVTVEAMVASTAVFGFRYGGGVTFALGRAQGGRAPRHALLVGARLMLNADATFDSHGDELSSYLVVPVGYAFLADSGFYFRAGIGPALVRERTTGTGTMAEPSTIGHQWGVSGPMLTVAFGWAWPWSHVRGAF